MVSADELIARADTNQSWESMMTHELAEEILERQLTLAEWATLRDALDDGIYEIVMSFR